MRNHITIDLSFIQGTALSMVSPTKIDDFPMNQALFFLYTAAIGGFPTNKRCL